MEVGGDSMEVLFKNKKTIVNIKMNDYLNDFVVVDSNMNEIDSKTIKGNKLILTIPSIDTRVCSIELAKFIELLKNEDIQVITVSMDLPFALERWCQINHNHMIVTSDFRYHDFASKIGFMMPEIGLFARSLILVDDTNHVRYVEVVENVHNEPDYQKVLEEIKKLKN